LALPELGFSSSNVYGELLDHTLLQNNFCCHKGASRFLGYHRLPFILLSPVINSSGILMELQPGWDTMGPIGSAKALR